jgi:hypothetical protein
MAASINTNRYRLLLLLYLTFLCLSLLSVPASLLESNLYVTSTLNFQEELIKKQEARSAVLLKEVNQQLLDSLPKLKNYLFLENEINRSFLLLDSTDNYVLASLKEKGTSLEREYQKRKKLTELFKKNGLIKKIEDSLFSLATKLNQSDSLLGANYSRWLPEKRVITTRNGKKINWANYFILDKPASVAYMQFKRIKLLLLQTRVDVVEQRNAIITKALMADQKRLSELLRKQSAQSILENSTLSTQVVDARLDADASKKQLELLNNIRLDRYYAGVSIPLLGNLSSLNIEDVDIEFSPAAKISRSPGKINVLFSTIGQYQLKMYLREPGGRQLLLSRTLAVQRIPDPEVTISLQNAGRNMISGADLLRSNGLFASVPVSGIEEVSLRINGFRVSILGGKEEIPAVYNYGPIFQDESKQLFAKLRRGNLVMFDNITITVGDGSTRSVKPVLYKISD